MKPRDDNYLVEFMKKLRLLFLMLGMLAICVCSPYAEDACSFSADVGMTGIVNKPIVLDGHGDPDKEGMCYLVYYDTSLEPSYGLKYPELDASLHAETQKNEVLYSQTFDYMCSLAAQDEDRNRKGFLYQLVKTPYIIRSDEYVLSVLTYSYDITVEASLYYSFASGNYDVSAGELIALHEIVKDQAYFRSALKENLENLYPDARFRGLDQYFADLETGGDPALDSLCWQLGYDGVTVIFNPYELAPYSEGAFVVTLPFSRYSGVFSSEYQMVPESYIIPLKEDMAKMYDISHDDIPDAITIDDITIGEAGDSSCLNVVINEKTYTEDIPNRGCDAYMINYRHEKTFLYVYVINENNRIELITYDISECKLKNRNRMEAGRHEIYRDGQYQGVEAFTNPNEFILNLGDDKQGTYQVGPDSKPREVE